jgi:hypothetical protein
LPPHARSYNYQDGRVSDHRVGINLQVGVVLVLVVVVVLLLLLLRARLHLTRAIRSAAGRRGAIHGRRGATVGAH